MISRPPFTIRLLFLWLALATALLATTVRPPQLDDLVTLADAAMAGTVTAIRSEWRESDAGRFIHTVVTFRIDDPILGDATSATAPTTVELDFLGGSIGEREMLVVGQPQFTVGDRELLFVARNGHQICPLVRMAYGRYRLVPDAIDARVLRVLREDGQPLTAPSAVSAPLDQHHHTLDLATTDTALSYAALRQEIVLRAQAHGRPVRYAQLP